jgi:hypothetical protein
VAFRSSQEHNRRRDTFGDRCIRGTDSYGWRLTTNGYVYPRRLLPGSSAQGF